MADNLILDQQNYHFSTRSTDGEVLNGDNKSLVRFTLADFFHRDESVMYAEISVPYIVIPVSFFQINESNNMLSVTEEGVTTNYFWETGNYNAQEFMTDFRSILPARFSITLDTVNNRFTVRNTTYEFSLNEESTIDYIMGFSGTITSSSLALTMNRVCNFLPTPRIMLHCSELGNGVDLNSTDVLVAVPNNSRLNSQIVYRPTVKMLLKVDDVTNMTFRITDDDGNLLNFNGLSCFWTIQLDIYRKWISRPPQFYDLVKTSNQIEAKKIVEHVTKKKSGHTS